MRYFIVDAETAGVIRYAASYQAYTDAEYASLLAGCGFTGIEFWPSLAGTVDESQSALMVISARKGSP